MSLILDGTNGETFPTWTTGTRPASPSTAQMGYNSTLGYLEVYTGSAWVQAQLPSAATSGNVLTANGTSWTSSAASGGLGGMTTFFSGTASRSGSVMTVTAVASGVIKVGDTIKTSNGSTSFGTVSSFGTGTGGTGTYNMSASGTISSTSAFVSSTTFTIPSGKTVVKVTVVGGGGGGGGYNAAGGGGAAGTAVSYLTGLTAGNTLTITVGNGGTGGGNANGNAGATSSVASGTQTITTVSATGGSGGPGVNTSGTQGTSGGGAGGSGSGGNLNMTGGSGSGGILIWDTISYPGQGMISSLQNYGLGGNAAQSQTGTATGNDGINGAVVFEY
jgi:hypothetical protein